MPEIPEGVNAVVDYFISIGLTAAVVGGLVSWIVNLWLSERIKGRIKSEYDEKLETHKAQLKAQGDIELEKLRIELNTLAARKQFQFSHLHEKRAEVLADIYASLREAVSAVREYTKAFEAGGECHVRSAEN